MSDTRTVLFDAPGPRARRRTVIISVVMAVLLAFLVYQYIYRPLEKNGQFSYELWGPLVDPNHEYFNDVWRRLGTAFRATLSAAALAIVSSLIVGTLLAVLRLQLKALMRRRFVGIPRPVAILLRGLTIALNAITRLCVEVFRGIPVVITIFFVWVWLPTIGAKDTKPGQAAERAPLAFDNPMWYLVIGLTIYNAVVIGEVLRSGMEGLPGGQREAAESVGLTHFQTIRLVLLPQAFRIMLPALISQLVVILKDTSLGFIIGYEELLRVSRQMVDALDESNPIQMYTVIAVIYILINYALSKLAHYVQHRLARGRRTADIAPGPERPIFADLDGGPTMSGTGGGTVGA